MKFFVAVITIISLSASLWAEPIVLENIADNNTNQLFGQLAQYQNQAHSKSELKTTWKAIHALLGLMAPSIKALENFRGVFAGNCTVFFNDKIDSANCELESNHPNAKHSNSTFLPGSLLPQPYWQQIRLGNILLASIYGDWRRGKKEKFDTNLYFKQRTCTGSLSQSDTESLTAELTQSDSIEPTSTQSESKAPTETSSMTPTNSETTHSITPPPTLIAAATVSKTCTQSTSATLTQSWELLNLDWAIWNRTTGVYADSGKQASRFSTQNSVVTDSYTGLQWEASGSASTYNWNAAAASGSAQAYCKNQTTGGFTNWELPTRVQLQMLLDYDASGKAINEAVFLNTQSKYYWTASRGRTSQPWAIWVMGDIASTGLSEAYCVRCVRSDVPVAKAPTNRYTNETGSNLVAESTQVKDILTGLIWQRNVSGTDTQANSKTDCDTLNLDGQSWRLPTIKELSTLVDFSQKSGAAIDQTAFPNTPIKEFWSSTKYRQGSNYWTVNFQTAYTKSDAPTELNAVRCVR